MAKTAKTRTGKAPVAKRPAAKPAKAKPAKAVKAVKAVKAKPGKAQRKSAKVAAALPIPASIPVPERLARPRALDAGNGALAPYAVEGAGADILDTLWRTVEARRAAGDIATSHSARLLARGTPKVAQKLGEEAVECVIEATLGNRAATVLESADLLYHLIVVWVDAGIDPSEVWAELARRQGISGIAEKAARPKALVRAANTTKLP
ncbi:phosphoribosyl-ATP diphosphatase [Falsiroseomonas sp. HC035]|uniref:phosphoribosyl-ATP diphosphatase n=1 Tax=Falsiroseomonas sp. HC035 TaxID=3390999 RepID=UPI003D31A127